MKISNKIGCKLDIPSGTPLTMVHCSHCFNTAATLSFTSPSYSVLILLHFCTYSFVPPNLNETILQRPTRNVIWNRIIQCTISSKNLGVIQDFLFIMMYCTVNTSNYSKFKKYQSGRLKSYKKNLKCKFEISKPQIGILSKQSVPKLLWHSRQISTYFCNFCWQNSFEMGVRKLRKEQRK